MLQEEDQVAKILIVDDDEAILQVLSDYLHVLDFETDVAKSVAEARKCLESSNYDAVLSDYSMSGETGLDLLGYLSSTYPKLPFLLMTGQCSENLKQEAMARGSSAYLEKPITPHDLMEVLASVFGRKPEP